MLGVLVVGRILSYHVGCTCCWSHPFLSCWVYLLVAISLIMLGVLVVGRTPSYHVGCTCCWSHSLLSCWVYLLLVALSLIMLGVLVVGRTLSYHVGCTCCWSHSLLSCWVYLLLVALSLIMLGVLVVGRTPSYHVGCTSGIAGHTSGYVECTVCHTLSRTYFSCETFNRLHAFICAISSIRVHVCQWPPCWLFVNYSRPIRSDNTFRSKAPGLSLWLNVDSTRSSDWYEF